MLTFPSDLSVFGRTVRFTAHGFQQSITENIVAKFSDPWQSSPGLLLRLRASQHLSVRAKLTPSELSRPARELDTETMVDASLFVDLRQSPFNEAGDYLIAAREGAIGPEHIRADLGKSVTGTNPGWASPQEITVFKSLGLAIDNLAAAAHIYQKVRRQAAGRSLELGC